jgi:hypothetical protein
MGENIGFLGSGDVYMRVKNDDGSWGGWVNSGGADKFELQAESEIKSQVSKGRGMYGQATDAVTLPKEPTIGITFNRPNRKVIAAHMLGSVAENNVTGAPVTGENVTVPAVGEGVFLAHRDVSAVTITGLTEGEDFKVDYKSGFVTNLADTPGGTWVVDYTYASRDGFQIKGVTKAKVLCQFRFDGKNMVDEKDAIVDVFEAQVAPSGGWDMLSNDHTPVELTGTCNTPTGMDAPWYIDIAT